MPSTPPPSRAPTKSRWRRPTIIRTARSHNLLLNLKPGETEATIHFNAPGARRHCADLHANSHHLHITPLLDAQMPSTILRLTNHDRYLGNYTTFAASLSHEAHHRAAQAQQALSETSPKVLRGLMTPRRLSVLNALVAPTVPDGNMGPHGPLPTHPYEQGFPRLVRPSPATYTSTPTHHRHYRHPTTPRA